MHIVLDSKGRLPTKQSHVHRKEFWKAVCTFGFRELRLDKNFPAVLCLMLLGTAAQSIDLASNISCLRSLSLPKPNDVAFCCYEKTKLLECRRTQLGLVSHKSYMLMNVSCQASLSEYSPCPSSALAVPMLPLSGCSPYPEKEHHIPWRVIDNEMADWTKVWETVSHVVGFWSVTVTKNVSLWGCRNPFHVILLGHASFPVKELPL